MSATMRAVPESVLTEALTAIDALLRHPLEVVRHHDGEPLHDPPQRIMEVPVDETARLRLAADALRKAMGL